MLESKRRRGAAGGYQIAIAEIERLFYGVNQRTTDLTKSCGNYLRYVRASFDLRSAFYGRCRIVGARKRDILRTRSPAEKLYMFLTNVYFLDYTHSHTRSSFVLRVSKKVQSARRQLYSSIERIRLTSLLLSVTSHEPFPCNAKLQ